MFSEVIPHTATIGEIKAAEPRAIVLSGGPASVYADDAPQLDPGVFDLGVPVFGICYGFQAMAQALGGTVERTGTSEYGRTELNALGGELHAGLPGVQPVWMSHGDAVTAAPAGFAVVGSSAGAPVAAFEDRARGFAGVQYHPEVIHTPHGQQVLTRFLHDFAGIAPSWTPANIAGSLIEGVREQIGDGRAICGLSGGVDSAVAAAVVQRAIGERLTCVFVDHGLLRAGERDQVQRDFVAATGARLVTVDAETRFLEALSGVSNPEGKRKIIGREFIRVFEEEARLHERARFLAQGTLYPDVIESSGIGLHAHVIKTHHNVGGLPRRMKLRLVEPLRDLFKDEVRRLGLALGLPRPMVYRQPFPGPGLAIRIIGEVTAARLKILREADRIVRDEIELAEVQRPWQYFAVLPAVKTVGVMGDQRTYGYPLVVRAVQSQDAMTADFSRIPYKNLERISNRIVNEIPGINRVCLDITSKPPATIEWE